MQRRIPVVLKAAGAFLIGGLVLAGCGAGPQNFTPGSTSSPTATSPTETSPATTSPTTSPYYTPASVPASTSSAPVTTKTAAPAPVTSKVAAAKAAVKTTAAHPTAACGGDYYVNSSGNCIHRPTEAASAPAGATAKCNDGTYSFSAHRSGTCSGHQGVAVWL
jgi:hypothetical protein